MQNRMKRNWGGEAKRRAQKKKGEWERQKNWQKNENLMHKHFVSEVKRKIKKKGELFAQLGLGYILFCNNVSEGAI